MKGIIIYSSKTGNTKNMAEYIYQSLKEICEMNIAAVEENKNPEEYDFALIGGWIDKGLPDSKTRKIIKSTKQNNLGIFVTLGAMPDSEHGLKVKGNLEKILENKNSLGEYRLPGLVDPKLIKKMEGLTGKIVPPSIKKKMVESGLNSRVATKDELKNASEFFKERVLEFIGGSEDEI